MSQNISEDEAKEQFEGIEILLNQARHQEAWELISPLLKMKDSFKEETTVEIINLAGCTKTSLMALDEAQALLVDGLNRSKAVGFQLGEAVALYHLGAILRITGKFKDALEHSKRAKEILKEIKDTLHIGYVHSEIGQCYFKLGQFHKAQEHLEMCISIHQKAKNKDGLQWALGQISDVYYALGNFERAVQTSREATEVAESVENEIAAIKHSTLEGVVLKRQGRLSEAKEVFQTLVPKLEDRDDRA
ncbi:MAG: tetratricopeptide repeat protein, partial [Candidatus Hodarchaeales archaeon]